MHIIAQQQQPLQQKQVQTVETEFSPVCFFLSFLSCYTHVVVVLVGVVDVVVVADAAVADAELAERGSHTLTRRARITNKQQH